MCLIITSKVVFICILFTNRVDVVGACQIQIKVLDTNCLGRGDSGVSPFFQVLNDLITIKGPASE
jgi:hypothetical protein